MTNYELKADYSNFSTHVVDANGEVAYININEGDIFETDDPNVVGELDASPFVKHVAAKTVASKDTDKDAN